MIIQSKLIDLKQHGRPTQPRWAQDSPDTGHIKKYITDGTSTYEADPRGPKTRIECQNGIAVQQVPSRDVHLKMAA
jgi:hypothetical protein